LSQISLPWTEKDADRLRLYRLRAIRWLSVLGLLLVLLGLILAGATAVGVFDGIGDWQVAVLYLGILAPICKGGLFLLGALAIAYYKPIGWLLQRPYVPLAILCGAVVGTGLVVWAYGWVSGLMQSYFPESTVRTFTGQEIYTVTGGTAPWMFVAYLLWPIQFPIIRDLIAMGGVVGFICTAAAFGIWWERKVAARMQSRLGPMRVGSWHGWAQSPADGIKLILKEDLIPADGDPILFRLAPYLAFVPTVIAFVALPFGAFWVFRDLDVALIFILAMLSVDVLGVIVAGLASNNKYATYGGLREACQMVAYEIPMGMSLLIPVMMAGTLKLSEIANVQSGGWHHWLVFANPWCFVAFCLYYVASLASCKRAPFDLPEAESELVAGFLTEYSGYRWSLFFFAEYAAMFAVSGLAVILFLGGWMSPLPQDWAPQGDGFFSLLVRGLLFNGPIIFILKAFFLFFIQLWLRWTLPRVRIDQVLYACVQVMLPMAMLVLLGATFWVLGLKHLELGWLAALDAVLHWLLVAVGYLTVLTMLALATYGFVNRWQLVGRLGVRHLPGA